MSLLTKYILPMAAALTVLLSCAEQQENKAEQEVVPLDIVAYPYTVGGASFKMVKVEGGSFLMGTPTDDPLASYIEMPQHEVSLPSFFLGETEVTQALWKAVMGSSDTVEWKKTVGVGDNLPAYDISWTMANDFIKILNDSLHKSGQLGANSNFSLPNEMEWEYAAKDGVHQSKFLYSGSDDIDEVGWSESNSGKRLHAVATRKENALAIYDMSGNVWEWCSNNNIPYPMGNKIDNVDLQKTFVIRGGSYGYASHGARNTCRGYHFKWYKDSNIGFRLCLR